jgi:hypothetical protein
MIQRPPNRVPPLPFGLEPEQEGEGDFEWAEPVVPLLSVRRALAADEADPALDFIGLGIDLDPQPFDNS